MKLKNLDSNQFISKKIKNLNKNVATPPIRCIIAGPSGSGKSNCMINLMTDSNLYKGFFRPEHIVIFSPTATLDDKLQKIKTKNLFDDLSVVDEIVEDVVKQQKHIKEKYGREKLDHVLFIFDDVLGTNILNPGGVLNKYSPKFRHYNISFIILTQKLSGVPRQVRLQANNVILFRPNNFSEVDFINEEFFSKSDRKKYEGAIRQVFDEDYGFIYIDLTKSPKDRYKKNIDEPLLV